uniref:Uncharacterized protein n=1 Tax=Anguilla anguilla TaxID=7936 RepID=A0A0E9XAN9_ANGAN
MISRRLNWRGWMKVEGVLKQRQETPTANPSMGRTKSAAKQQTVRAVRRERAIGVILSVVCVLRNVGLVERLDL